MLPGLLASSHLGETGSGQELGLDYQALRPVLNEPQVPYPRGSMRPWRAVHTYIVIGLLCLDGRGHRATRVWQNCIGSDA